MKKHLLLIILLLLITPTLVNAETNYLYDVLKDEAENNGLAREYTREHKDSFTKEPTHKIYHWYSETQDEGNQINNKNNVILGNYCWKMIRTTDTGGVKLLYNGNASNGKCYGSNISIGSTEYAKYDNFYYLGAIGYMHNELYSETKQEYFNFGTINQTGNKIPLDDYNIVSNSINNTCQPYRFNSSNEWELDVNCLNGSYQNTDMIFKVNEPGNYIFNYNFSRDWNSDRLFIYINNELNSEIGIDSNSSIILNNISTTDEIKVSFDPYKAEGQRTDLTFSLNNATGDIVDTRFNFGNDVEYSNGLYTLKNVVKNDGFQPLKSTHYFCRDGSLSCENVIYIVSASNNRHVYYKEFSNGKKIEDLINDQLRGDNVNVKDSPIKALIDRWYENNLMDYSKYFEDALFCQKKTPTTNNNYLNKDNGMGIISFVNNYSYYESDPNDAEHLFDTNLKCDYETDMYSVSNPKAKLKYPIALMNYAEALLLSKGTYENYGGTVRSSSTQYWLLTPYDSSMNTYGLIVNASGSIDYNYGANTQPVRPMVSLKKEATYSNGDGSMNNPYIINDNLKYSIGVEVNNETEDLTVEIEDLSQVPEGEEVNFKVTPIKGHKLTSMKIVDVNNNEVEFTTTDNKNFTFTMPADDVIIKPSYERVKNAVNVEDNKNTKEFVIEVNDATAVVYEDKVKFKVEPEEGYEVEKIEIVDENNNNISYKKTNNINEYEFTMPDTNVLIKPFYRLINRSNLPNPNTKRQILLIVISALILCIMTIIFIKKKKHKT